MIVKRGVFDTIRDTNKNYVSEVKTRFSVRSDARADGTSQVQLHITGVGDRKRIGLPIFVRPEFWNKKAQRIRKGDPHYQTKNLKLEACEKKAHEIRAQYFLADKHLTNAQLEKEFIHGVPRIYVTAYMTEALKLRTDLAEGTRHKLEAIIAKIDAEFPKLMFSDVDATFADKYRQAFAGKNRKSTIESNLRSIKSLFHLAEKDGIRLRFDMDDFKVHNYKSERPYLTDAEVDEFVTVFRNKFLTPGERLKIGYFLAACYTGKRLSEIMLLDRDTLLRRGSQRIEMKKVGKYTVVSATKALRELMMSSPDLFKERPHPNLINGFLKSVAQRVNIDKRVSMHVGRHTFATRYLRHGGKVEDLKVILGHSSIRQTMHYVHLVEEEQAASSDFMESLYS